MGSPPQGDLGIAWSETKVFLEDVPICLHCLCPFVVTEEKPPQFVPDS